MQPDLNQLMRKARQMQEAMQTAQTELAQAQIEGTSGGGAVKITCTGGLEFSKVKISKEAVDPEDVETLEDLVLTAIQDCCKQAQELAQKKMGPLMGGMGMPPGMGF